ncbi:MAG: TRAP transporter substrate-binding protein [Methyloceanibacter sp.]|uniref:TRAP transporter substrate-binding protein n=1 Tax=Methyloceanibacter sp. TaxID=1965321 RepID=UPI003D6D2D0B
MANRVAVGVGAVALAACLLLQPTDARAEEAPVALVTPLVYGTHLPGLGKPAAALAKAIKERSGGDVVLDLKEPGDGTKPHEILDKVADGTVDAGIATASFWAAKVPAASLFAGYPFGPDAKVYLAWFDKGNGRKLYQEMYDHAGIKVHVIPCAFGGAEAGGWFVKEINAKKDLEGLRMRIFGLGARVAARLGVVPVLVAGGALAEAFKKGKIDAAELYTPAVDREQGLQDTVKIIYMPGWHQPETVLELLINKDRWNALGTARQEAIEAACRDMLRTTLGESAGLQAEALASLSTKDGVRILDWPDQVIEALREAWAGIAKEEGARDYFFKEVLDDIEKFQSTSSGAAEPPASPEPDAAP